MLVKHTVNNSMNNVDVHVVHVQEVYMNNVHVYVTYRMYISNICEIKS